MTVKRSKPLVQPKYLPVTAQEVFNKAMTEALLPKSKQQLIDETLTAMDNSFQPSAKKKKKHNNMTSKEVASFLNQMDQARTAKERGEVFENRTMDFDGKRWVSRDDDKPRGFQFDGKTGMERELSSEEVQEFIEEVEDMVSKGTATKIKNSSISGTTLPKKGKRESFDQHMDKAFAAMEELKKNPVAYTDEIIKLAGEVHELRDRIKSLEQVKKDLVSGDLSDLPNTSKVLKAAGDMIGEHEVDAEKLQEQMRRSIFTSIAKGVPADIDLITRLSNQLQGKGEMTDEEFARAKEVVSRVCDEHYSKQLQEESWQAAKPAVMEAARKAFGESVAKSIQAESDNTEEDPDLDAVRLTPAPWDDPRALRREEQQQLLMEEFLGHATYWGQVHPKKPGATEEEHRLDICQGVVRSVAETLDGHRQDGRAGYIVIPVTSALDVEKDIRSGLNYTNYKQSVHDNPIVAHLNISGDLVTTHDQLRNRFRKGLTKA
jgi:hypothetical protein